MKHWTNIAHKCNFGNTTLEATICANVYNSNIVGNFHLMCFMDNV